MAESNVEIVRRAFAAYTRRPKPDFEVMNELFAPDHVLLDGLGEEAHGGAGFSAWWATFNETWESHELILEDVIELGSEMVLIVYSFKGVGKRPGVTRAQRLGTLMAMRGGKITRTEP